VAHSTLLYYVMLCYVILCYVLLPKDNDSDIFLMGSLLLLLLLLLLLSISSSLSSLLLLCWSSGMMYSVSNFMTHFASLLSLLGAPMLCYVMLCYVMLCYVMLPLHSTQELSLLLFSLL